MALQSALLGGGVPPNFRWSDRAAPPDGAETPADAGPPPQDVASENLFGSTDRVELSGRVPRESGVQGRIRVNLQTGLYERLNPLPMPALGTSQSSTALTRVEDWLDSVDPELSQAFLAILEMLRQQDEGLAERFVSSLEQLRRITGAVSSPPTAAAPPEHGAVADANLRAAWSTLHIEVRLAWRSEDGEAANLSLQVSAQGLQVGAQGEVAQGDPLILDLDGDGIDLKGVDEGPRFDLTGTGRQNQTAFIQGDDALLYLDRNGNGVVDDGRELFGDQEGDAHGFAELAQHDENGDQRIDARDGVFDQLRLWQDRDGNGIHTAAESLSLAEAGITGIDLDYRHTAIRDGKGNTFTQLASFTTAGGLRGLVADALLAYVV